MKKVLGAEIDLNEKIQNEALGTGRKLHTDYQGKK